MNKFLLISLLFSAVIFAEDEGKELHNESCLGCHLVKHNKDFYTREDRKMDSLTKLNGQISRCTQAFNVDWFPEEEKSVSSYLNRNYYHLK